MREIISGIYCIENIDTGKKYIGQSKDIKRRWQKHVNALNSGTHRNDYLQHAWDKYGSDSFKFYIIEKCDVDMLDEREIYYISYYNTTNENNGYNLMSGGQFGNVPNEVTRKKLSDSVKKSYESGELRDLRSEMTKKYWENPDNKQRMLNENNVMYGKHHTDETKQKISDTKKSKHYSTVRRNREKVYCVELNKEFLDATTASKELNLDSSGILKTCRGERHTCGGYHWIFVNNKQENNIS